jgi:ureidoacrylate peracid hydrolase
MILEKDTYIPLEAVVKRAATHVFINVPKLIIGKTPWDLPPAKETSREKRGRPAAAVEKLYASQSPTSQQR